MYLVYMSKNISPRMMSGQRFDMLTTVGVSRRRNCGTIVWLCKCDCGGAVESGAAELRSGVHKDCGCRPKPMPRKRRTHAATILEIGSEGRMKNAYNIWAGMKSRCYRPSSSGYKRYGARGIKMCDRWLIGDGVLTGYECFIADVGERPSLQHSIDRIDHNGNYTPENCRWALPVEQQNNRRGIRRITAFGKTMSATEWSREVGIAPSCITNRLDLGWDAERAVSQPTRKHKVYGQ